MNSWSNSSADSNPSNSSDSNPFGFFRRLFFHCWYYLMMFIGNGGGKIEENPNQTDNQPENNNEQTTENGFTSQENGFGSEENLFGREEDEGGSLALLCHTPPMSDLYNDTNDYIIYTDTSDDEDHQLPVQDVKSALGLKLTIGPEVVKLIQETLTNNNENQKHKRRKNHSSELDKTKAINFPAQSLRIGTFEVSSKREGDLVAKCYFAKHKLVWEILVGATKRKLENAWSDITSVKVDLASSTLEVELNRPPSFARETDPKPRKHTQWEDSDDFTGGQALIFRRHLVRLFPEPFEKQYEKLMEADIFKLSRGHFPIHQSPYFQKSVTDISHISVGPNAISTPIDPRLQFHPQYSTSTSILPRPTLQGLGTIQAPTVPYPNKHLPVSGMPANSVLTRPIQPGRSSNSGFPTPSSSNSGFPGLSSSNSSFPGPLPLNPRSPGPLPCNSVIHGNGPSSFNSVFPGNRPLSPNFILHGPSTSNSIFPGNRPPSPNFILHGRSTSNSIFPGNGSSPSDLVYHGNGPLSSEHVFLGPSSSNSRFPRHRNFRGTPPLTEIPRHRLVPTQSADQEMPQLHGARGISDPVPLKMENPPQSNVHDSNGLPYLDTRGLMIPRVTNQLDHQLPQDLNRIFYSQPDTSGMSNPGFPMQKLENHTQSDTNNFNEVSHLRNVGGTLSDVVTVIGKKNNAPSYSNPNAAAGESPDAIVQLGGLGDERQDDLSISTGKRRGPSSITRSSSST